MNRVRLNGRKVYQDMIYSKKNSLCFTEDKEDSPNKSHENHGQQTYLSLVLIKTSTLYRPDETSLAESQIFEFQRMKL